LKFLRIGVAVWQAPIYVEFAAATNGKQKPAPAYSSLDDFRRRSLLALSFNPLCNWPRKENGA
jgi:hypothetical protein